MKYIFIILLFASSFLNAQILPGSPTEGRPRPGWNLPINLRGLTPPDTGMVMVSEIWRGKQPAPFWRYTEDVVGAIASSYTHPAYTPGSVLFAGADGQPTEDNPNFFFNDTQNSLFVGPNAGIKRAGGLEITQLNNVSTGKWASLSVISGDAGSGAPNEDNAGLSHIETVAFSNTGLVGDANNPLPDADNTAKLVSVSAGFTGNIFDYLRGTSALVFRGAPLFDANYFSSVKPAFIDFAGGFRSLSIINSGDLGVQNHIAQFRNNGDLSFKFYPNTRNNGNASNVLFTTSAGDLRSSPPNELQVTNPTTGATSDLSVALTNINNKDFKVTSLFFDKNLMTLNAVVTDGVTPTTVTTSYAEILENYALIADEKAFMQVSGGSTSFVSGTPERLDGDTPGTTTDVVSSSDWSLSGSVATYSGETKLFEVEAIISGATGSVAEATYYIAKNGVLLGEGMTRSHANTDIGVIEVSWIISIAPTDEIDVRVDAIADETFNNTNYTLSIRPW